jgi:hypothetical protein
MRRLVMRARAFDARPFAIEEAGGRYAGSGWRQIGAADSLVELEQQLAELGPSSYRRRLVAVIRVEEVADGTRRAQR